jgi:hypothetical protein
LAEQCVAGTTMNNFLQLQASNSGFKFLRIKQQFEVARLVVAAGQRAAGVK